MEINIIQPDKQQITMQIFDESMSCYSEEDYEKNPSLRGTFKANVFVQVGHWGDWNFKTYYSAIDKTFYFDNKGIYTYKKQKEPFYYWKCENVTEEYEHWAYNKKGKPVPLLNEPRKIKKNIV